MTSPTLRTFPRLSLILLLVAVGFLHAPDAQSATTHETMPFPSYGKWCGQARYRRNIQFKSRRTRAWNAVDRLCRDFYRCCKETTRSTGPQRGLCHCRCYQKLRKRIFRAIRRTRSRKGRRIGNRISRIAKFHQCRCDNYRYCKSGRSCRVENVCRNRQRVCKGGKCRWIRKRTCSKQLQCYMVNQCVSLTRDGAGGVCESRKKILEKSDNRFRVNYLHRIMKSKK